MQPKKLIRTLQSRKFWATILGLLMTLGIYTGTDLEADKLVDAITLIVSSFTVATGIEHGLSRHP